MNSLGQLYSECSRKRDYVHTMFIGFKSNDYLALRRRCWVRSSRAEGSEGQNFGKVTVLSGCVSGQFGCSAASLRPIRLHSSQYTCFRMDQFGVDRILACNTLASQ
jgi:hypothetical protein